jgi:hypothetical protein
MFDLLFIALFQAAAGEPAPPQQPSSEPASAAEPAVAEAPSTTDAQQSRRCNVRQLTGTRVRSVVRCRSGSSQGQQSQDARDALHDLQRPAPTNGG